jgi:hypothetical protein
VAVVKLNHPGIGEVLQSAAVRAILTDEANEVLRRAQANAPVASGAYRASLHVEQDTTDRAVARVIADVPYAMVVEADTGNLARSL